MAPLPKQGPVIVTFFASWCPPCTLEFRHLNEVMAAPEFGDAQIVAINMFELFGGKEDPVRMARFLDRTKPQFPTLKGTEEMRVAFGNVERIPTVIVYGNSGEEVWRFIHIRDAKKTHATKEDVLNALKLAREG